MSAFRVQGPLVASSIRPASMSGFTVSNTANACTVVGTVASVSGATTLTTANDGGYVLVTMSGSAPYAITLAPDQVIGTTVTFIIETAAAQDVTLTLPFSSTIWQTKYTCTTSGAGPYTYPSTTTTGQLTGKTAVTVEGGSAVAYDSIAVTRLRTNVYQVTAQVQVAGAITI